MSRTIKAEELKSCLSNVTIIDVRRKTDFDADSVMLPGARWRDPERVSEWASDLTPGTEVVLYCVRGGSVSNSVLDQLLAKQLRARFIEGGIEAWKQAGGSTRPKTAG